MNLTTIKIRPLAAAFIALGLAGCGGDSVETDTDYSQVDTTEPVTDWELVWQDEFDGSDIDEGKWNFEINCEGGGNNEQQCYTDSADNAFVSDGTLKIVAMPAGEDDTGSLPYTSALLNSKNKGDFTYGRVEVRAKLPEGQGSWPAVWMMPTDAVYGGWPKSGEIDIVEAVNLKTTDAEGNVESNVHGTLHYGRDWPNNSSSGKAYQLPGDANPADDFHTYAMEWQEGEIRWYVDGYLYQTQRDSQLRYNSKGEAIGLNHQGWFTEYYDQPTGELTLDYGPAPYDQSFYLIMNLAVGGDWPENTNNLGIDDSAFAEGQTLEVDYIKVYQCNQNPDTGKGCETVRAGYDDEETLVTGEAPIPTPPSTTVENLTIFDGTPNPNWPAWDCCGGSTPELIDDEEKGQVYKFVVNDEPTVNGFVSREEFITDGEGEPQPFDATGMIENGSVSFDMKLVSPPSDSSATWLFKFESDNNATYAELPLTDSTEGVSPTVGEWQTYTYPLQQLVDAQLEPSALDAFMVFPAWGLGAGAEYLLTNVEVTSPDAEAPELVLFGDEQNPDWPLWDCCGGTTPQEVVDEERGVVGEFEIGATPTVVGFKPAEDSGIQFDASALMVEGVVQFDMKVVSNPNDPDSVWKFKVEANGAETEVEVDLSTGGQEPVVGEWQTYAFSLQNLMDAGLDLSAIDVVMVYPAWGTGDGAVFRVDEARIYDPSAGAEEITIFADDVNADWSLMDCCAGSEPQVVAVDEPYGNVAQFEILGSPETVLGFQANEDVSFDASALLANGAIGFDMRVIDQPQGADAQWLVKVESSDASVYAEVPLASGNYDEQPVAGEWQRYHFTLQSLFDAGLDISDIKVIMIFPTWGQSSGAVYQVDNLSIENF
ncbi:beta-glucanase (GH16 family) [Idiomarina loihiensis]|uniref:glycoside hydrolase family 16 protein n=1 Tax=Idiomarina TaxID=135575 RepID=UPI000D7149C7|nr:MULTISPECIES: glycoside hydrolase family 16 protein [Idiomarina]PWW36955.1 beta-glucanase (GH16 family) [Idiomarina loihiensis]TDP46763.1 beta-glucanase (GH16 family) [Idiomarina loihiensis]TDS23034.1 beta-glucanase (GH16 family) [Idiomarina sp. H2]